MAEQRAYAGLPAERAHVCTEKKSLLSCAGKSRRMHKWLRQQRALEAMERSGCLGVGAWAKHLLLDPWRNMVEAQQDRYTVTFDLKKFGFVRKPSQKFHFSRDLVGFFSTKKKHTRRVHQTNCRHRKIARTFLFKEVGLETAERFPTPLDFGKLNTCPYCTYFKQNKFRHHFFPPQLLS